MTDSATIWLPDAKFTRSAGASLAATLYRVPLTISLTGELGAGKTTFLQGFLAALGISDHVVSPTYALEQRYDSEHGEILHIDLYRLNETDAKNHIEQTDDHEGIRCIEWADKAGYTGDIHIELSDKDEGRELQISFNDIPLPTKKKIELWRDEVELPSHIIDHCEAVANFAEKLGAMLLDRGIILRPLALRRAAEVHDLLRFIDFQPGAGHAGTNDDESPVWETWKKKYEGLLHEPACAEHLKENGFMELARIVAVHGLRLPPKDRTTPEQKLLYYSDKRMMGDKTVSLDERFEDFAARYTSGPLSGNGKIWYKEASDVEKELFSEGTPY